MHGLETTSTVTSMCIVISRVSLTWVMFRMWFVYYNWLVVCYSCPGNPRADEKYQERRGICQEVVNSLQYHVI